MNLGNYLQKLRFYLRDALQTAYQQQDLIDLINQARADVITDTFCCRALTTNFFTTAGQDKYSFGPILSDLQNQGLAATQILAINSMSVFWSGTLVPMMDYLSFDDLSAIYRSFRGFTFIPFIWGMFDFQTFFVEPIPNSGYKLEIDCTYLPNTLVNTTDVDTVLPPAFGDFMLVPLLAASYAKYNQNAYNESQQFYGRYVIELERRMSIQPVYRIPSMYGSEPRRP